MRILLVGGLDIALEFPHGTGSHILKLAETLIKHGHSVEMFTVVSPGYFPSKDKEFEVFQLRGFKPSWAGKGGTSAFDGLVVNCLVRKDWIIYRSPYSPMKEVYEPESQKAWLNFLSKKSYWDVIHFHQIMPYSIIHMTKELGYRVAVTLHDLQYVDPNWRFFDYAKYYQNPVQDLTRDSVEPEGYVLDVLLHAGDEASAGTVRALTKEMRDRIEYGKYILTDVADVVATNLFPAGIFAHLYWDVPLDKMRAVVLNPAPEEDGSSSNPPPPKKPSRKERFVIGCLGYCNPWKGQLVLLNAVKYLKDLKGRFEVRFYGCYGWPTRYHALMKEAINEDDFLKDHVKLLGAYKPDQLDGICSKVHLHVVTTPIRMFSLCEGVFGETLSRNVPNLHITGEVLEMYDELLGVNETKNAEVRSKMRRILKNSKMFFQDHLDHIVSLKGVFGRRYNNLKRIALYETGNPEDLANTIRTYIRDPDVIDENIEAFQIPSPAKGLCEEEYITILYS